MAEDNIAKFDKFEMTKKDLNVKPVKDEQETSYMSSPISTNDVQKVEQSEEDSISNIK